MKTATTTKTTTITTSTTTTAEISWEPGHFLHMRDKTNFYE